MANIQEKIAAFLPEAVFEEGQYPTFTVPAEKLPVLARYLRDEDELQFDNLRRGLLPEFGKIQSLGDSQSCGGRP